MLANILRPCHSRTNISKLTQLSQVRVPFRNQFNFTKKNPPKVPPKTSRDRSKTTLLYLVSLGIATVGCSYAAVPLYRWFNIKSLVGSVRSLIDYLILESFAKPPDTVEQFKRVMMHPKLKKWSLSRSEKFK